MQEEVLKLVLLALEDGSALSRKVLVMFVVQRLEPQFPQASKTSIGHVVQLLYRASCFKVSKREGDSSLMQLKDEFRSYEALRREHDAQIVQIATEAGLRIAPDQWSALLYGDTGHKSHMQSIIDKLQSPQSFAQSVQELVIALQRTPDPSQLSSLRLHLERLAAIDPSPGKLLFFFFIFSFFHYIILSFYFIIKICILTFLLLRRTGTAKLVRVQIGTGSSENCRYGSRGIHTATRKS